MRHLQGISTRKAFTRVHKMDHAFGCVQWRKTERIPNNLQMFRMPRSKIEKGTGVYQLPLFISTGCFSC